VLQLVASSDDINGIETLPTEERIFFPFMLTCAHEYYLSRRIFFHFVVLLSSSRDVFNDMYFIFVDCRTLCAVFIFLFIHGIP
jgi:hypothetical protein